VKEVFQVELKLLSEKVLATHGLLAEEEMGSPLLGLVSLHDQQVIVPLEDLMVLFGLGNSSLESLLLLFGQGVIESLMKMKFPLGQVTQPWVNLLVETLGCPQVVLPLFLLQEPN
jgi:hypothetical protein